MNESAPSPSSLPVTLRGMRQDDLVHGAELSRMVNWNHTIDDWRFFYGCNPDGCFVAECGERVVGTAVTLNYDNQSSWIGMVIVHPELQRRGIGKRLLNACIDKLSCCSCIKLDATPAGKMLYDTLGFVDEYNLKRMANACMPAVATPVSEVVRAMREDDLPRVVALDAHAFGVARPALMEGLFRLTPEYAHVAVDAAGDVAGFTLGRHGRNFEYIGPVNASTEELAIQLASACYAQLEGRAVLTDAFLHTPGWINWLESIGFEEQRCFIRMVRGDNVPGKPEKQFAIAGPEIG